MINHNFCWNPDRLQCSAWVGYVPSVPGVMPRGSSHQLPPGGAITIHAPSNVQDQGGAHSCVGGFPDHFQPVVAALFETGKFEVWLLFLLCFFYPPELSVGKKEKKIELIGYGSLFLNPTKNFFFGKFTLYGALCAPWGKILVLLSKFLPPPKQEILDD